MNLSKRVAGGTYRGIWILLRDWFRVPADPPTLGESPRAIDGASGSAPKNVVAFRPAEGFLQYLNLQFWVAIIIIDTLIIIGWIAIAANEPTIALALALPALLLVVLPDILVYLAIRLRFDTTWYVMSDRSIRIRRGIWVIQEITITFENVQNVSVSQGPLQRYFGIADVTIQTAGGGGGAAAAKGASSSGHHGLLEGVGDAERLRDMILAKVHASRKAGLGDERDERPASAPSAWSEEHLAVLRAIRDRAQSLATAR
jgi:membrane protein YdbS with pleckstrin-like domain